MQIEIYAEQMSASQLGIFCLAGSASTLLVGYTLCALTAKICTCSSKVVRAIFYYTTIAFLVLDPLYLSILCGFFGGGDMNGIRLLCPEWMARAGFGAILLQMASYSGKKFCLFTKSHLMEDAVDETNTARCLYDRCWNLPVGGSNHISYVCYPRRLSIMDLILKKAVPVMCIALAAPLVLSSCSRTVSSSDAAAPASSTAQEQVFPAESDESAESAASSDESWKTDFEKSLLENYNVTPEYYEDLGDGIYQVYVKIDGKVVPYVAVDSATGDYHG